MDGRMINFPQGKSPNQQGKRVFPNKEPPLIHLVEQYLADNSNLSYINIDDMVDTLQSKYHRFARMQRRVFSNQIRSAYFDYCKRNPNSNIKNLHETEMETNNNAGANPLEDSDSDIEEIQNEYTPKKDIANSHLTALYASTTVRSLGGTPKNDNSSKAHCSDTFQSVPVKTIQPDAGLTICPNVRSQIPIDDKTCEDISDNDLEIIDEVQGDGVIKRASESNGIFVSAAGTDSRNSLTLNTSSGTSTVSHNIISSQTVKLRNEDAPVLPHVLKSGNLEHSNRTQNSQNGALTSTSNEEIRYFIDKNPNLQTALPTKGIKRKTPPTSYKGLNEDYTPKKQKKEISVIEDSGYRLSDFAGSEKVVEEVCRLLMHLKHPEVYKTLGVTAPRGFLLHGPPGTGKTLLANSIAGELQMPLLKVTGTEFVSGISGESEGNIRDLFMQALAIAPCIIFIDEIDSITPKRENAQREMERRIVAQLLSCVDDLMNHEKGSQVLLIGATNRIEAIDTALRRAGRFDREICLGIPDEKSRDRILAVICRNLRLAPGFDLGVLAKLTPGYVGADLQALVREAAVQAVNKALISSHNDKKSSTNSSTGVKDDLELQNDDIMIVPIDTTENIGNASKIQIIDIDTSSTKSQQEELSLPMDQGKENVNLESNDPVSSTPENLESNDPVSSTPENLESNDLVPITPENVNDPVSSTPENVESKDNPVSSNPENLESNNPVSSTPENVECKDNLVSSTPENVETKDNLVSSTPENFLVENSEDEKMQVDSAEEVAEVQATSNGTPDADLHGVLNSSSELAQVTASREQSEEKLTTEILISNVHSTDTVVNCQDKNSADSKIQIHEEEKEKPSYLRWIRETAPLQQNELDELYIFMDDFEVALKNVQPSSKREGFATVPDTTWDDIGALKDIREELEVSILGPVKYSSAFQMLGLNTPAGVLLCGPPGCGKTLLAKAVANEAGINFISVKGPELLNMYVGESERAVRQCFLRAKNSSPCVIFFDELDALCPRRSSTPESGSGSRIVNQLLTEMDGIESRAGVFVMAATNRPDIIDPAILRPGRLDKILFVDLPTAEDRYEILKAITKEGSKPKLAADVNLDDIANRESLEYYTGADLAALVREASIAAFKDLILDKGIGSSGCIINELQVSMRHFETAFTKTKPSVTKKDRDKYAEMKERYSSAGGR